jgi:DNA-binding beta-propeller fold protein YncE
VIARTPFTLVDEQEVLIARPHALVVSPDGHWIHTASLAENRIASVDVATGRVTLSSLAGTPRSLVQFTIGPRGQVMTAGGEMSNTAIVFPLGAGVPPLVPSHEFTVGGKPWDGVFSPDGRRAYYSLLTDDRVVEIDPANGRVLRTFGEGLAQPDGMIMRRDGRYLFVANRNTGAAKPGQSGHEMHGMPGMAGQDGWVSVIDVASGKTVATLMLGASPTGVGAAGAR